MEPAEQIKELRPERGQRIYDLVLAAGGDVRAWHYSKDGTRAIDPADNIYMNTQWTYICPNGVLVACIWWRDLDADGDRVVHQGSSKDDANRLLKLQANIRFSGQKENRLSLKIGKAQVFDRLMSSAYRTRSPVRVVLLEGETPALEESAFDSSVASKRRLDDVPWWVHAYDVWTGNYQLVRGISPPPAVAPDPFDGADDPGDDPSFQAWLDRLPLSQTEIDALIKARVGQGWFRDALIKRWGGCAVTSCRDLSLLVASHIKPWRHCETRAERLGPANGLLLAPHYDKAFDAGLITFDPQGLIRISKCMSITSQTALNIMPGQRLRIRTFDDMQPFLTWHSENVFQR